MGGLLSVEGEHKAEAECNERISWVKDGNEDEPEPRSDEQLAMLSSDLARIRSIYQLDGQQYVATISSITCKHLANVEMMGENDPYVKLSCGKWEDQTVYQDGAGKEAEWDKLGFMFPLNDKKHRMQTRNPLKYKVEFAKGERLKKSPVVYMQMLLNKEDAIT